MTLALRNNFPRRSGVLPDLRMLFARIIAFKAAMQP
jgi:hypothetical protein